MKHDNRHNGLHSYRKHTQTHTRVCHSLSTAVLTDVTRPAHQTIFILTATADFPLGFRFNNWPHPQFSTTSQLLPSHMKMTPIS